MLIAFLASANHALAQRIEVVRTDVDSTREDFITASYIFGIDVFAMDVEHCNSVGFDLHYTHQEYVKFNQWSTGDFGKRSITSVIDTTDPATGERFLYVIVSSTVPLEKGGLTNPRVIHLEFALTRSAPHD